MVFFIVRELGSELRSAVCDCRSHRIQWKLCVFVYSGRMEIGFVMRQEISFVWCRLKMARIRRKGNRCAQNSSQTREHKHSMKLRAMMIRQRREMTETRIVGTKYARCIFLIVLVQPAPTCCGSLLPFFVAPRAGDGCSRSISAYFAPGWTNNHNEMILWMVNGEWESSCTRFAYLKWKARIRKVASGKSCNSRCNVKNDTKVNEWETRKCATNEQNKW